MTAAHIDAANSQRDHGTDAEPRPVDDRFRRVSGLKFDACSVIEGIAVGLIYCDDDVLMRLSAVGILNRGVDLLKEAKVIKAALALEHILLAEGRAGLHADLAASGSRASVVKAVEKKLVDKELLAFVNGKSDAYVGSVLGRFDLNIGDVDGGVGKSVVEILGENGVAVGGEARFVEALAFRRSKFPEAVPGEACNCLRCEPTPRVFCGPSLTVI